MEIKNLKMTLWLLLLMSVLLFAAYKIFYSGRLLVRSSIYEVVNEKGEKIPVRIYKRKDNGFIIVFDQLSGFNEAFVFFPKDQVFGLLQGGKTCFKDIFGDIAYQRSKMCDAFKIIYYKENFNDFFKDQSGHRFIKSLIFLNTGIEFSSFLELKKYGKKIIVRKRNNVINKEIGK